MSDSLNTTEFVLSARDLTLATVKQNKPSIVIEAGTQGSGMVGILRAITFGEHGLIIKAAIELGDNVETTEVACNDGLYIIQGKFAEMEYTRRLASRLERLAEADNSKACSSCGEVHDEEPPPEVIEALRSAIQSMGGRVDRKSVV